MSHLSKQSPMWAVQIGVHKSCSEVVKSCGYLNICKGGCHAVAKYLSKGTKVFIGRLSMIVTSCIAANNN